jgi:hypothetical protein
MQKEEILSKGDTRMTRIEAYDKAIESKDFDTCNWTLLSAYHKAVNNGNELIDFSECIWDRDIEPIADALEENDIDGFTISSTFSGLTEVLMLFQDKGFRMQGMVMVANGLKDWVTGEPAMVPAALLKKEN